ncbi:hypothetical protein BKA69DRAFT_1038969 [Paraphysoderma sedebokerense]|nr:hypothetical protein BKA69DRAFT_1040132 [Paraphysoderma sedebokerense]KAI9140787.1 hypothetical protein BKA69DRAFT_1038969 [Paraphysoderma sedebokerense]
MGIELKHKSEIQIPQMEQLFLEILYYLVQFVPNKDLKSLRLVNSIFNEPCRNELFRTFRFYGSTLRYWAFDNILKWRELQTCSFLPDVRRIRIDGGGEHSVAMILSDLFEIMVNLEKIEFIESYQNDDQQHLQYALPPTLRKLKFENYISIPLETFPENLQEIDITNCHVEPLHVLLFPQKLKRLCLINCEMTTLPYLPQYLHSLDIYLNEFTELPELPPLLHTLICEATKLSRLPPLPPSLRVLRLWNNPNTIIDSLPSRLEELIVTDSPNFVKRHPELPSNLISLRLGNCDIASLPPNYLPKTLRLLDLSNNQLTTMSQLPPCLEDLDLMHNKLAKIPDLPTTLVDLDLSHNALTELPELPPRLESLRCSHNQISEWPSFPKTLKVARTTCNFAPNLLEEAMIFVAALFDVADQFKLSNKPEQF